MSKGEEQINNILLKAKIKFEREKTFNDLKHGLFRFDFYVKNYQGAPAIIEVNGQQHYKFVSAFYRTKSEWNTARGHDRRKISYCLANDIPIFILPYWDLSKIHNVADIFQSKYQARTRWHNDEVWNEIQQKSINV